MQNLPLEQFLRLAVSNINSFQNMPKDISAFRESIRASESAWLERFECFLCIADGDYTAAKKQLSKFSQGDIYRIVLEARLEIAKKHYTKAISTLSKATKPVNNEDADSETYNLADIMHGSILAASNHLLQAEKLFSNVEQNSENEILKKQR